MTSQCQNQSHKICGTSEITAPLVQKETAPKFYNVMLSQYRY